MCRDYPSDNDMDVINPNLWSNAGLSKDEIFITGKQVNCNFESGGMGPTKGKYHCQENYCTAFCLWLKVATQLLKRKWVLNRTKWVMNGMLNEAKIITHYSSFNDYSKIIELSKKTLLLKSTQFQIVLTRLSNARAWSSSCFLDLISTDPPLPPSPGVYFQKW